MNRRPRRVSPITWVGLALLLGLLGLNARRPHAAAPAGAAGRPVEQHTSPDGGTHVIQPRTNSVRNG
jgi:hypothetical protein